MVQPWCQNCIVRYVQHMPLFSHVFWLFSSALVKIEKYQYSLSSYVYIFSDTSLLPGVFPMKVAKSLGDHWQLAGLMQWPLDCRVNKQNKNNSWYLLCWWPEIPSPGEVCLVVASNFFQYPVSSHLETVVTGQSTSNKLDLDLSDPNGLTNKTSVWVYCHGFDFQLQSSHDYLLISSDQLISVSKYEALQRWQQ